LAIWIKKYIRIIKAPLSKKKLALEVFCYLFLTRLALFFLPFRVIVKFLEHHFVSKHCSECDDQVIIIGRVIKSVSRYTPWESLCLVQALTGKIMLKNRGLISTVYLGLSKSDNTMKAHAWLKYKDIVVTGSNNGRYKDFTAVKTFGENIK